MSVLDEGAGGGVKPARWQGFDPVLLAAGGRTTWWYTWGDNRGPQYASPNVSSPGILMWALRQGKRLEPNGSATYFVEILNEGPQAGYHNLEGGTFA